MPHLVDTTMFWNPRGGGVRRYLLVKRNHFAGSPAGWRQTVQPRSLRAARVLVSAPLAPLLIESDEFGLLREPSVVAGDVVLGVPMLGAGLGDVAPGEVVSGDAGLREVAPVEPVSGEVALGEVRLGSLFGLVGAVVDEPGDAGSLGVVDCAYTMPPTATSAAVVPITIDLRLLM